MAWPATVRVQLSSEAAGAIPVTPVVVQNADAARTHRPRAGCDGKGRGRIREIPRLVTLVNGASRFRRADSEADPAGLEEAISGFSDPSPSLPCSIARCLSGVLRDAQPAIKVSSEPGYLTGTQRLLSSENTARSRGSSWARRIPGPVPRVGGSRFGLEQFSRPNSTWRGGNPESGQE